LNSQKDKNMTTTMTTTTEKVQNYTGTNTFIAKMKDTITKYGKLTPNQDAAVVRILEKESNERTIQMNWPTPGETLIIGRKIGQQLKETYGLEFNPMLIDITRLLAVSPKAVKFVGKMTIKRGKICTSCMKDLTDEFSMLTGMGKICAKHMKIEYIKNKSETERFREDYLKRVEEIGEMEFWVPKNQIRKWTGMTQMMVNSMM
jgi:hypothetical protein